MNFTKTYLELIIEDIDLVKFIYLKLNDELVNTTILNNFDCIRNMYFPQITI